MKSFDFDAVVVDGEVYCVECCPENLDCEPDPIFPDSEWDYYPICCVCNYEHDYVNLLEYR